ncbi:hypothetical protein [Amycolatopsis pithecellobii]|uniref:Uncharacterized protein n=1 Tax=Amycolatopsis pithecellobii TaxID=664692 RepID=A0A6N7Z3A3_9PSEU|nr:hypothetical protein [Amycolatopsis pithecellobii]MTD56353.1 hypothetical protein [Amycolatopsis pithecellobii]
MRMRHRCAVAATLALLVFTSVPAEAAETEVVTSCVATVPAGQPVALAPEAVVQPVIDLLTPLDPLGLLVPAFRSAWAQEPPISLPAGDSGGSAIADAVLARLTRLPLLAPVLGTMAGPLRNQLSESCGITTEAPVRSGPPDVASVPTVVGTRGVIVVPGTAITPPAIPSPETTGVPPSETDDAPPPEAPPPKSGTATPPPPALIVTTVRTAADGPDPAGAAQPFGWPVVAACVLILLAAAYLGRGPARRLWSGVQRTFRPSAGHHRKP